MKTNTNHIGVIKQSLGWLAVVASAGLAVGALAYHGLEQKIERDERQAELTESMARAVQFDGLLRQLGEGRADVAKDAMTSELAYDVKTVSALSASAEGWEKETASQLVAQVVRDEKKHPEYYAAATRLEKATSGGVIQVVARH